MAGDALRAADLPGRGRGLLAARNIREGEVILTEQPLLLYPASLASLPSFCSACFRSFSSAASPCPSCRAAGFCSPSCAAASHPRLHAMVAALVPPQMLPPGFSPDLTAAFLSKDRTNSFSIMEPYRPEVPQPLRKARAYAVYPRASLLNHDCLPNACHFDYADRPGPGNTDIVVRALHDITEGREVCLSYFAANWQYKDRQQRLLEDYGFRCECERCQVESKWKQDDDSDGGDGDDTMEEEEEDGGGEGGDDGMEQEEGDGGSDSDDDFPHSYFFVRYLCNHGECYGMLAPLPPLPNGEPSHVFECNVCGNLKNEDEINAPDGGDSSMAD
uniref:SET domain-containing protein n=1 Tax=Oryza glaberrima TaxID=4538 RepID=I1QGI1_ORYGL